jgi:16S rRNA (uracil1498-N3)-methyltransferase
VTRSTAGDPGGAPGSGQHGSAQHGPAQHGPGQPGSQPPVFFADAKDLASDLIVLAGPEGRHAADVRRLTAGERVDLTDGEGQVAECVVTRAQRGQLELAVRQRRVLPAPDPVLAVAQAIPKGERGQLAVELMTEAGVDVIVPWAAERCVARWQGERGERAVARWRSTAREAAKQARRSRVPEVTASAGLGGVAVRAGQAARAFILDPQAAELLSEVTLPRSGEMLVIVGPEGGITPAETSALTGAGATAARLGPTVLRTSSAGMAAAAVLLSRAGRWT